MSQVVSYRQRMLAAIDCRLAPGQVPCSFMLYNGLKESCRSYLEFIQRQLDLGLDAYIQIPPRPPEIVSDTYNLHGLPVCYHPSVVVREWKDAANADLPGERWPLLIKEYHTPAGILRAEVYQDSTWCYGDHVPFLDDYLESRSRRFIINEPQDLSALAYLLVPPTLEEQQSFRQESQLAIEFARQNDLLLAGGWGVGADMLAWIYGLQRMVFLAYDQPQFLQDLLALIAGWNQARMQVVLEAGVDLYIKRAWYENCDFWTPQTWRQFILPTLRAEVQLAHENGARFGYLITSNCMPLLESIAEAGVDVVIGVDPHRWDLQLACQKLAGRVCLWGGVNGHLTVETGRQQDVRQEVQLAFQALGESGGWILSPVDNVRTDSPEVRLNVMALIEQWKALVG